MGADRRTQRNSHDPPLLDRTRTIKRRATFFDVETLRAVGGQTNSLEELMLYECAHQLFYELVSIRATAIDSNDSPNAWINEGLAEFHGMH